MALRGSPVIHAATGCLFRWPYCATASLSAAWAAVGARSFFGVTAASRSHPGGGVGSWRVSVQSRGAAVRTRPLRIVVLDAGTLAFDHEVWQETFRAALSKTSQAEFDLKLHDVTTAPETVLERARGATIVATNKVPLGAEVLRDLRTAEGGVGLVCSLATGFNQVDVAAARVLAIDVCNIPDYASSSTAQHTLALLLSLCNRVETHSRSVEAGGWERSPHFWYQESDMVEIRGRDVGLIGLGSIGGRVAEMVQSFQPARILVFTPSKCPLAGESGPGGVTWAGSVEEVFAHSDIISLHCPLTSTNQRMVNAELLGRMRPGALLINAARGGLVDEQALADALQSGQCRGAALDVLTTEPPNPRRPSPLVGLPNCLVTPHYGWSSIESRQRLLEEAVQNICSWMNGEPRNLVN